ncbi:ribosomal protein L27e [Tritrichomonas foetus]|uniref:Ribosomal protein L27e n=1 Tax=Tritrichomonas foetus TaxID=1144522 RepID=A0A1J4J712_9EUKA|nr:ribosomal protein L27e [Tritrichomonas foetus]|eukprot:OHS95010.1 ribosomal protein L27e [Tritrichomonas foetus]
MSAQKTLIQPGRLVILLNGRHAGKKGIVLAVYNEPTEARKYPHCVVLGIEKAPKKLTKDMPQETLVKRTQVKCFLKTVNFNHVLLTRHVVKPDDDLFNKIKPDTVVASMQDAAEKKAQLEATAKVLRQKYLNNKLPWLFKPLQF